MNTITVSATKARNTFFELLDRVASGVTVIITKDAREVATLTPKKRGSDLKAIMKAMKTARGALGDYTLKDSPLRKPGAADFLGKWDRPEYNPYKDA